MSFITNRDRSTFQKSVARQNTQDKPMVEETISLLQEKVAMLADEVIENARNLVRTRGEADRVLAGRDKPVMIDSPHSEYVCKALEQDNQLIVDILDQKFKMRHNQNYTIEVLGEGFYKAKVRGQRQLSILVRFTPPLT